jgi:hypothetical protein
MNFIYINSGEKNMKKFLLFIVVAACIFSTVTIYAQDNSKGDQDEILRKSTLNEPTNFTPDQTSYPCPFNKTGANNDTAAAVSTGYYFVDNDDEAPAPWRPDIIIEDINVERNLWRRIIQGPRMIDSMFWYQNPDEGWRFFRDPALPTGGRSFFKHGTQYATDSTDNAIAGPIPIGFAFIFNGIRYDSFYVGTNGIIALTNRRYFYDVNGQRTIPAGASDCYDPMSMDWFVTTRPHIGNGLTDPLADDWGYRSVLDNQPTVQKKGIRATGGDLHSTFTPANKAAVIAPFFCDGFLSQYNHTTAQPEDFGQVWFKRTQAGDRLIIYFKNLCPINTLNTPNGPFNGAKNLRPTEASFLSAGGQVVLNRNDSTVTINYEQFTGMAIVSNRPIPSTTFFRYNSTVGVRGFARHVKYNRTNGPVYPWYGEYEQYTHYFNNYANPTAPYPHNYLAIKFKQWKNVVREVKVQYRLRNLTGNPICFNQLKNPQDIVDFEMLAGEPRIGAIQPVVTLQNLTNDIQGPEGVNYQPQDLKFKGRFVIVNQASLQEVYNRVVNIDSLSLLAGYNMVSGGDQDCSGYPYPLLVDAAGTVKQPFPGTTALNGVPPYGYVKLFFPAFEPSEYTINQIGRMKAIIVADPTNSVTNESLGDQWPFDDTTSTRFFVMKRLNDFYDDVTHWHMIDGIAMPSTLKWVNIEGEVAAGDDASYYPLPPRGDFKATNNQDFNFAFPDFTTEIKKSPVIRLDRVLLDGTEPPVAYPCGDEIRSFPIDMRGKSGAYMTLGIQRGVKQDDWPRGWNDNTLTGPEPRSVVNGNQFHQWTEFGCGGGAASIFTDSIMVEFARPSADGVQNIVNLSQDRWKWTPRKWSQAIETNLSTYTLYGAGGGMRVFLENNPDSVLRGPDPTNGRPYGLRFDIYDDGFDYEYKQAYIPIPDTLIKAPADGAKNFRFRIRVAATEQKLQCQCTTCIPDDKDPFFVDNIKILYPSNYTDLEVTKVEAVWPYTIAPLTQTASIPIRVNISNNTALRATAFLVKVRIYRKSDFNEVRPELSDSTRALYCRIEEVPFLLPTTKTTVTLPNFNAAQVQNAAAVDYVLQAQVTLIRPDGTKGDMVYANDMTYQEFHLQTNSLAVFAYDPASSPRNDVPDGNFTGIPGRGLSLFGYSTGSIGNIYGPGGWDENDWGAGDMGGSGSGQFASKFTIVASDTLFGYQAWFGTLNQSPDYISFSIYKDNDKNQPDSLVEHTTIMAKRGVGVDNPVPQFDKYVTYVLPAPVILSEGTYWMTIGQLSARGIELGGSKTRSGQRVTSVYFSGPAPYTTTGPMGAKGYHLNIDKTLRVLDSNGNLLNQNNFMYENSKGSGNWLPFEPTVGNTGYAHLDHTGLSPIDNQTSTLSRGSWIPMIRPYFGKSKPFAQSTGYKPCPDDTAKGPVPVELTYFDGQVRHNGNELFWETSSEINNAGYYVEKNIPGANSGWNSIGFIKGAGTSNSVHQYNYLDENVRFNTTYEYRLRQVDNDGVVGCQAFSNVVTLTYDKPADLVLEPNNPNPFSGNTRLAFTLPEATNAKLEIIDIFGNTIKTLVNTNLQPGLHEYIWDGSDEKGVLMTNGTYIYILTTDKTSLTGKMTILR